MRPCGPVALGVAHAVEGRRLPCWHGWRKNQIGEKRARGDLRLEAEGSGHRHEEIAMYSTKTYSLKSCVWCEGSK